MRFFEIMCCFFQKKKNVNSLIFTGLSAHCFTESASLEYAIVLLSVYPTEAGFWRLVELCAPNSSGVLLFSDLRRG